MPLNHRHSNIVEIFWGTTSCFVKGNIKNQFICCWWDYSCYQCTLHALIFFAYVGKVALLSKAVALSYWYAVFSDEDHESLLQWASYRIGERFFLFSFLFIVFLFFYKRKKKLWVFLNIDAIALIGYPVVGKNPCLWWEVFVVSLFCCNSKFQSLQKKKWLVCWLAIKKVN